MQPILIFFAYAFEMRFVNFCQFSTDNKKKRYNKKRLSDKSTICRVDTSNSSVKFKRK